MDQVQYKYDVKVRLASGCAWSTHHVQAPSEIEAKKKALIIASRIFGPSGLSVAYVENKGQVEY